MDKDILPDPEKKSKKPSIFQYFPKILCFKDKIAAKSKEEIDH